MIGIGRAPDNDGALAGDVVSRHHAELRRRGAEWELIGLGSNGTFVEGEPRQRAVLSERFGLHVFDALADRSGLLASLHGR